VRVAVIRQGPVDEARALPAGDRPHRDPSRRTVSTSPVPSTAFGVNVICGLSSFRRLQLERLHGARRRDDVRAAGESGRHPCRGPVSGVRTRAWTVVRESAGP